LVVPVSNWTLGETEKGLNQQGKETGSNI
jgi:hypothetical protein